MKRAIWLVGAGVLGGAMVAAMASILRDQVRAVDIAIPSAHTRDVVINEVAWMGTAASGTDEWIELYNTTDQDINLAGWTLTSSDGTPVIHLVGTIPAHSHYLLERTDDNAISDVPADQVYTGDLLLEGETLTLTDSEAAVVDTANAENDDQWPAGSNNPDHTMERIDPTAPDADANWCTNNGVIRTGLDADANPVNGTPGAQNSCYQSAAGGVADLTIAKTGPITASPDDLVTYHIVLSNTGTTTATATLITDSFPSSLVFITQTSSFTFSELDGILAWEMGDVLTDSRNVITISGRVIPTASGTITNLVTATTAASETNRSNNTAGWRTAIVVTHAPLDVVINEVAWAGHAGYSSDEWIELYNTTDGTIDLYGWTLISGDGSPSIYLTGVISPHGYYLLERDDDDTVSTAAADQIYAGNLNNTGESLTLRDATDTPVDSANGDGGAWPEGAGWPDYHSMERRDPTAPDTDANWCSNDGSISTGQDAGGNPINGTPQARNSCYPPPHDRIADLEIAKSGPATVSVGGLITYQILLSNIGTTTATAVRVTDTLPAVVSFITQTSPFTLVQLERRLIWMVGDAAPQTRHTITLTARVRGTAVAPLTNVITATTTTSETTHANNSDIWETAIGPAGEPHILISAVLYDGYQNGDLDEAVQLTNVGTIPADLGGWYLADDPSGTTGATFPDSAILAPGDSIWCARNGLAFADTFGFKPDYETDDSDPTVPELTGSWPGFANTGDECALLASSHQPIDVLVTGDSTSQTGWSGTALQPWAPTSAFAKEGQILYRKLDQITTWPVTDTDTAADWAQHPDDHIDGRKVQYPGWDLAEFFQTAKVTETATLEVAIAPDNAYEVIKRHLEAATTSILIEGYTFENAHLIDAVVSRALAGCCWRGGKSRIRNAGSANGSTPLAVKPTSSTPTMRLISTPATAINTPNSSSSMARP